MSFESALKRPFQDIKTLLIGSGISLISMFIFITFPLLSGYMLECARRTFKKDNSLPEWGNWGKLFMDGIKLTAITFIYIIPFSFTMALTIVVLALDILTIGGAAATEVTTTTVIGILIMLVAGVISVLFSLAGILRFAQTGVFGDAFKFSELKPIALSWKLFGKVIVVVILGGLVNILFSILPIVGIGLGAFVVSVFSYTMYAETYMELGGIKGSGATRAPAKRTPKKR